MGDREKKCAVAGCEEALRDDHPLCRRHWASLDARLRELIFRAQQHYRRQPSREHKQRLRGLVKRAVIEAAVAGAAVVR